MYKRSYTCCTVCAWVRAAAVPHWITVRTCSLGDHGRESASKQSSFLLSTVNAAQHSVTWAMQLRTESNSVPPTLKAAHALLTAHCIVSLIQQAWQEACACVCVYTVSVQMLQLRVRVYSGTRMHEHVSLASEIPINLNAFENRKTWNI